MPDASVVVVGGGASGLSAAAALKQQGIDDVVVLEQDPQIGGTWARRYDRLHLHTVRGFSGLAHFGIPRRYPAYLSRDEVVQYLREYVDHFGLNVINNSQVSKVTREDDSRWNVAIAGGGSLRAPAVVIATGQYRLPLKPSWPAADRYRGELTHSVTYSNAKPYAGKRVLVVGAGNSGAEIATDIAENGARFVAVSIRTPPMIVPRDPFGMPVQRTGIILSFLPPALADRIGRLTARITLGDLTKFRIPRPSWGPYSARRIPLIDVGFVNAVKRGLVQIRPAVERLTPTGAVYSDGVEEPFDAIVAAIGFSTGLESLINGDGILNEAGEPIVASGEPTSRPGLYFIGFVHSLRGHLFEANRASRRLAKNIHQYLARQ